MKRIFLFLMVFGIVMFLGCENNQNIMEPDVTTTGNLTVFSEELFPPEDCFGDDWDALNSWAEAYIADMTIEELNAELKVNECLTKWMKIKIENDIADGTAEVIFQRVAEWHSSSGKPPAKMNENCFGGDINKLYEWVDQMVRHASDKAIINASNYNPCARYYLYLRNLMTYNDDREVKRRKNTKSYYVDCIYADCSAGCTVYGEEVEYTNGDWETSVEIVCDPTP